MNDRSASKNHELQLSSKGSFTLDVVRCIQRCTAPHVDAFTPNVLLQAYALRGIVVLCGRGLVIMNLKTCLIWSCLITVATGPCMFSVHV